MSNKSSQTEKKIIEQCGKNNETASENDVKRFQAIIDTFEKNQTTNEGRASDYFSSIVGDLVGDSCNDASNLIRSVHILMHKSAKGNDQCQEAKEALEKNNNELTNKIGTLNQKNSELIQQNQDLHNESQKSGKVIETLQEEKGNLSSQINELTQEKSQCQTELTNKCDDSTKVNELIQQHNDLCSQYNGFISYMAPGNMYQEDCII